jgi:hypothetical protein
MSEKEADKTDAVSWQERLCSIAGIEESAYVAEQKRGDVYRAEGQAIHERRAYFDVKAMGGGADANVEATPGGAKRRDSADLIGLSLSGGGIRSAMFNLGLLQAFWAGKLLPQIDYMATVSGGGYVGSRLSQAAASWGAARRAKKFSGSQEDAEKAGIEAIKPAWFPFNFSDQAGGERRDWTGAPGRAMRGKPGGPKEIYLRGNYLNDPCRFFFNWLPGGFINLMVMFSLLAAMASAFAFLFRIADTPTADVWIRTHCANFLIMLHRAGMAMGWGGLEEPVSDSSSSTSWDVVLDPAPYLVLSLIAAGFIIGRVYLDRIGPRIWARALALLGMFVLASIFLIGVVSRLDWPTAVEHEVDLLIEAHPVDSSTPRERVAKFEQILDKCWKELEPDAGRPAWDAIHRKEVKTFCDVIVYVVDDDLWSRTFALKSWGELKPDGDRAASAPGRDPSDERAETDVAKVNVMEPDKINKNARLLFWEVANKRELRSLTARPPGNGKAQGVLAGGTKATAALAEFRRNLFARDMTGQLVTDLTRALIPAMVMGMAYLTFRAFRYVCSEWSPKLDRRLVWWEWWTCALGWVGLILGGFVILGNGDTDVGGLKYLMPDAWNNSSAETASKGVLPSARFSLSGTFQALKLAALLVPTVAAGVLALIPLIAPGKFLQSSERPKDSIQGQVYRLVLGSFLLVFPLAAFFLMARENVSGAAPTRAEAIADELAAGSTETKELAEAKAKAKKAKAKADGAAAASETDEGDGEDELIARLAFCPEGIYVDRGYLIQNDQGIRLCIVGAGMSMFLLVGLLSNVNGTSIHGFYREKLREAYLNWERRANKNLPKGERTDYRKVKDQCGSEVGAPYHIISATLNVIKVPDDEHELKESRQNFIFSPLFCGSDESGFRRTDLYHEGVDLADAIAISGGAISPVQGRSLGARFLMAMLNMRLGQWYGNPNPAYFTRHFPTIPGLLASQLFFRSRMKRGHYFLSDGAHRDNLGLELLLQRRCRLIIVSDVSNDPNYELKDLVRDLRRARIWEGIRFAPISIEQIERKVPGLFGLSGGSAQLLGLDQFNDSQSSAASSRRYTRENSLFIRVLYPKSEARDEHDRPASPEEGLLIVLKPSLSLRFPSPRDLDQYYRVNPSFPHDPDLDQIYDEDRIEAYRQLGEHIGGSLAAALNRHKDGDLNPSFRQCRAQLLEVVDLILKDEAAPTKRDPDVDELPNPILNPLPVGLPTNGVGHHEGAG